jgi:predicted transcriptional regulator
MLAPLFGNSTAERVLLFLQNYEQGYAREIAAAFGIPLLSVQRQLQRLENGGILVSRMVGRTRLFTLNPRYYFKPELTALLEKALSALPDTEVQKYYRRRSRPRRSGKPLPL